MIDYEMNTKKVLKKNLNYNVNPNIGDSTLHAVDCSATERSSIAITLLQDC